MRPGAQEQFLSDHAVILMSDHAQIAVSRRAQLAEALSDWRVLQPNDPDPESAELAVAPGARSAMVYALAEDGARERLRGAGAAPAALASRAWTCWRGWRATRRVCGAIVVSCGSRPGRSLTDRRRMTWDVDGSLDTIELEEHDGLTDQPRLPGRSAPHVGRPALPRRR